MKNAQTVEILQSRIAHLVAERQDLRAGEASQHVLEENRRDIAHSQHELSRALIERYLPHRPAQQAA
jgi:hypothetical protein